MMATESSPPGLVARYAVSASDVGELRQVPCESQAHEAVDPKEAPTTVGRACLAWRRVSRWNPKPICQPEKCVRRSQKPPWQFNGEPAAGVQH